MPYLKRNKCIKYADDIIIYCSAKTVEEVQKTLQEALDNLQQCAIENVIKTKCMLFKPNNLKCNNSLTISINNLRIDNADTFRYLGILLESFNFNS